MEWIYDDGGRSKYFKAQGVRDCVTRAISIATGIDYKEVYDTIKDLLQHTPRNSLTKKEAKDVMHYFGFDWVPTMKIGSGCTTHLREEELPKGTIVCVVTGHYTCVKDGIIYDTFNPSRGGERCVYGYWVMGDEYE